MDDKEDWSRAQFSHEDWIEFLQIRHSQKIRNSRKKMLSSIASYLWSFGGSVTPEEPNNTRITATEGEEEDWLLVNAVRKSRSSSPASSLSSGVEETWFVTPPPCFTSSGPVTLETSPLENLLIEHPSMSVYHRATPGLARNTSPSPSPLPLVDRPPNPLRPRRRQPFRPTQGNGTTHPMHPPITYIFKNSQKAKMIKENQLIRTKHLERGNKTREVNKRNKRPRRADRQKNHSGANNNRKCC